MSTTLSIVIPVVIIAYGVWLAVRMIRNRSTGKCGDCGNCPYAGGCHSAGDCQLKQEPKEAKKDA